MRKIVLLAGSLFAVPAAGFAQNAPRQQIPVPAINDEELPPSVPLINSGSVPLPGKAVAGLGLAQHWQDEPQMPIAAADGSVQYLFGATLPTLVCAPLRICLIQLQPGEVVQQIDAGDAYEWHVTPAVSGTGPSAVTNVIVKPTNAGLQTNLVISTDKRTYTINLISDAVKWMPSISFAYPEDIKAAWSSYQQQVQTERQNDVLPSGQNVSNLDFNYSISGDDPDWKPVRVYNDGAKTYIDFRRKMLVTDAPVLLALGGDGNSMLVNYRVEGSVYIVDRVLEHAELISGVGGSQTSVKIDYTGSQN